MLRLGLGLMAIVLLAATGGAIYQAISVRADLEEYPPPGELIEMGGRRLHLQCQGSGSPVVLLDAGAQLWSASWSRVQKRLAETTTVCAHDRAGLGWSDPVAEPQDGIGAVRELHALVREAGLEPPFVYVGHSLGTMLGRIYHDLYPEDLAGMVFVGSLQPAIRAKIWSTSSCGAFGPPSR